MTGEATQKPRSPEPRWIGPEEFKEGEWVNLSARITKVNKCDLHLTVDGSHFAVMKKNVWRPR